MNLLNHQHLIVRAEVDNPPSNPEDAKTWILMLIDQIRMKIASGLPNNPNAYYCDMPGNRGLTVVAIIETSHVAMHVWDEVQPALIQLDVYSCAEFKKEEVFEHFQTFDPVKVSFKFIDRNSDLTEVEG